MDSERPFFKMEFGVILHAFGIEDICPGDFDEGITLPDKKHGIIGDRFLCRFIALYKLLKCFCCCLKKALEHNRLQ
ncbi:hypothetical protein D3C72_2242460 [compost metagenome]